MTLFYKGNVREFRGMDMVYADFEKEIDLSKIGEKQSTAVNDLYIIIKEVQNEQVGFSLLYFDKETNYVINQGEKKLHKYEGNAFGFEIEFELR